MERDLERDSGGERERFRESTYESRERNNLPRSDEFLDKQSGRERDTEDGFLTHSLNDIQQVGQVLHDLRIV